MPSRIHRTSLGAAKTLNLRGNLERRILSGKFGRLRIGRGSGCRSGFCLGAKIIEALDGENLLFEDAAELACCAVGDGFEAGQGLLT